MKEMVGGCCVCSDERGWTENPLVYCDGQGCNVAVHQGKNFEIASYHNFMFVLHLIAICIKFLYVFLIMNKTLLSVSICVTNVLDYLFNEILS